MVTVPIAAVPRGHHADVCLLTYSAGIGRTHLYLARAQRVSIIMTYFTSRETEEQRG